MLLTAWPQRHVDCDGSNDGQLDSDLIDLSVPEEERGASTR